MPTETHASLTLRLNNTDESLVQRFRECVDIGTVYGPYRQDGTRDRCRRKPFWVWVAQSYDACEVLALLAPWLSVGASAAPTN